MSAVKKQQSKMDKYIDPTGEFPNSELKAAVWYAKHKKKIHDIGLISFIAFDVILILINLYVWISYFTVDYTQDERNRALLTKNYVSSVFVHNTYGSRPLKIGAVIITFSAPGKYDFISEVSNDNLNFKVELEYQFLYDGGTTEARKVLIMPGSKMVLTALGQETTFAPQGLQLRLINTNWTRIDPHLVVDQDSFVKERRNFTIDNFDYFPAYDSSGAWTNTIIFDITNNSNYGYWEPSFFVIYKNGGSIVGVKKITINTFQAWEKRNVELKSLTEGMLVTEVEVIPAIDLFDNGVYIPVGTRLPSLEVPK